MARVASSAALFGPFSVDKAKSGTFAGSDGGLMGKSCACGSKIHPMDVNDVVRALTERIQTGAYASGSWLPPERDIADQLGVSRTIVQSAIRALEQSGLVEREPRCRPRVADSAGISPTAGEIRTNEYVGACIWPVEGQSPVSLVAEGIRHTLSATQHRLVMVSRRVAEPTGPELVLMEGRYLQHVATDPAARGVVIWYLGGEQNRPYLEALRHRGLPIVFVDRQPPEGFEADVVSTDHFGSARHATSALIDMGHRRIACVASNEKVSSVFERQTGYVRALESACLEVRPEFFETINSEPGESEHRCFERIVRNLLTLKQRPTAILSLNDDVANGLIAAMHRLGVRVPEQCSVVGFDGTARLVTGSKALAGCVQDFVGMGERVAELLLERIRTGRQRPYVQVLYNAPFRKGESVAPIYREEKLPKGIPST